MYDHYCRITRQRLGQQRATSALPLPDASFDSKVLHDFRRHIEAAKEPRRVARLPSPSLPFHIRSIRADTLWRQELTGRRIDVLKVTAQDGMGGWDAMGWGKAGLGGGEG